VYIGGKDRFPPIVSVVASRPRDPFPPCPREALFLFQRQAPRGPTATLLSVFPGLIFDDVFSPHFSSPLSPESNFFYGMKFPHVAPPPSALLEYFPIWLRGIRYSRSFITVVPFLPPSVSRKSFHSPPPREPTFAHFTLP